jgi:CRP-like cAMP-binding protein
MDDAAVSAPPSLASPAALAAALRALAARPTDHGAWLVLAAQLGALGFVDDAERVFGIVGQSGLRGGQVALAVACGRLLAQRGNMRGPELLEDVAAAYCRGSELVSDDAVPAPHADAVELSTGVTIDDTIDDTIDEGAGVEAQVASVRLALEVLEPVATRGASDSGSKLPTAPLLSSLPLAGARALIGVMTARTAPAGEILVEVGQPATSLYWLAYGDVAVSRDGVTLGELHGGGFFGEIALVGGTTRTAQVVARSDVWLLEIPARAVEAAAQKHPQLAAVLAAHAKARLLANLMRTSELFRELPAADLGALLEKFSSEIVEAGTRIIAEGKPNAHLWVVVAGRCDVQSAGTEMARLGPGAAVGEISLVSGKPAVADVVAVERSVLLRLSREDFRAQVAHHPELLERVESLVVAREEANRALFHDASDLLV